MELVAVPLDLLEEAADAAEVLVSLVHPALDGLGQLRVGPVHVDLAAPGDPEQLLLVPLAGRVPPGLDGAAGERGAGVRDHAALVVAEEVSEPLALGARAERVVEGEEQGLGPLERRPAGLAAELLAVAAHLGWTAIPLDLHHGPAAALAKGLLEGAGQASLALGAQQEAVEDHVDRLPAGEVHVRERGQRQHLVPHLDPREATGDQPGEQVADPVGGGHRQREPDQHAGAGRLGEQGVGHAVRCRRPGRAAAARAMDAADLGVEQPQVVGQLGGGADRRAGRPHGVLLLERDRGPDVLDEIDVGPVDALEEHPRVAR